MNNHLTMKIQIEENTNKYDLAFKALLGAAKLLPFVLTSISRLRISYAACTRPGTRQIR